DRPSAELLPALPLGRSPPSHGGGNAAAPCAGTRTPRGSTHAASYHHREAELAAEKAKDMAKISSLTEELQAAEADLAKALGMVEAEQGKARQLAEQLLAVKDEYASAIGAAMAEKQVLWAAQSQHTARVRQLQAAEAESAAKVCQLTKRLQAAEAEAGQLKEQLVAERAQHADKVMAVKIEYQNKVINAEHASSKLIGEMLSERYAAGLRDMRDLVLLCYPGEVDPTQLMPEALGRSVPQGFGHPYQPPTDQ
ncbi:hypothetical protein EJB05_23517, partial [Eragrostis curvula]